jgi:hypothetical protein
MTRHSLFVPGIGEIDAGDIRLLLLEKLPVVHFSWHAEL